VNVRKFLDEYPILYADWKKIPLDAALEGDASQAMKPPAVTFDRTGWVQGPFWLLAPPDDKNEP
jgi:hypothetical protein